MNVRLLDEADADVLRIGTWWRANRPAAPNLFSEEVDAVISLLETAPDAGEVYKTVKNRTVRRTGCLNLRRWTC